jgi:hypothetical protein
MAGFSGFNPGGRATSQEFLVSPVGQRNSVVNSLRRLH